MPKLNEELRKEIEEKFDEVSDKKSDETPNRRNFIAHSGLERNCVELRKDEEGKVWLRYNKNQISSVMDYCCVGLH